MRQIKFRGKSLVTDKWTYGDLIENQGLFFIYHATSETTIEDSDDSRITVTAVAVYGGTVGRFTGLPDKNGKEIYEGDLLEWEEFSRKKQGVVVWRDYGFCAVYYRPTGTEVRLKIAEFDDAEVVGNIHDNPELLKGGEK